MPPLHFPYVATTAPAMVTLLEDGMAAYRDRTFLENLPHICAKQDSAEWVDRKYLSTPDLHYQKCGGDEGYSREC